jgi:hypothetical protein
MANSKSKVTGELNVEEKPTQSVTPSSVEARGKNILVTSEKTATPQPSLISFQPTVKLQEDEATQNLWLAMAFLDKLSGLGEWKKLEVDGLGEVYAFCLPTTDWIPNSNGSLVRKME